jgi:hypothetical protein
MGSVAGWLLLTVLTGFAFVNALGIGVHARTSGRAELATVTMAALFALLGGPVLVLGYANVLTPTNLALASLLTSAAAFFVMARRRGARAHLRECGHAAMAIADTPFEGLREAARARSAVFIGLLFAGGIITLAFVLTALVPYASWDGFFYHEPIIGYALQNHGFAVVDLPPNQPVQSTNGYPRICEAISLWFVVFTDKTLVELPNDLAAPGLMWCVYALARRYTDRVTAMGCAVVLLFMPATWTQLSHSYIDVQVGFFLVVATYFATRPDYRIRDAVLATLGMALAVEAKNTSLAWVPPLALIAYGRLVFHHFRGRRFEAIVTALGCGAFVAGLALHILVRNWIAFRDPFWPIAYDNKLFDIHWHGLATLEHMAPEPPLKAILETAYSPPTEGVGDVIRRGYGYAVTWVIVPVAAVGVVAAMAAAALEALRLRMRTSASNLAWVLVPALIGLKTTPSLEITRYNLHIVTALIVAAAWLVSRLRGTRAREALVAPAILLSLMPLYWLDGWGWYWCATKDMKTRLLHPLDSPHTYVEQPTFDFLGRQRFEEIHAGDRVAYTQDFVFPGALWNFDFSNRVEYIPFTSKDAYLSRIERYDPKWVAAGDQSAARSALEGTGQWETVGRLIDADSAVALRRKR